MCLVYTVDSVYSVDMIEVPGARLYVERAGDGPPLLLIPGGGGDAGMYAEVVPLLAERFTVLSYDRRGNSRSPLTDPAAPIDVPRQAADAVAIFDHHGFDRGYVFGNSGGAIVAVELVAHHGDRLLGVVAHEPALVQLLVRDSPERRAMDDIVRLARQRSPMRAYAAFGAMILPGPPRLFRSPAGQAVIAGASRAMLAAGSLTRRISHREPDSMTRQLGNAKPMFDREIPAFCVDYRPDLDALAASRVPWRLATGRDSVGRPYHRPAHVLAEGLGMSVAEFSGGHTPYLHQPEEFTAALTGLLTELDHERAA